MIYLDELTDLRLYNRNFFIPINKTNKRKGSCILLLTPNFEKSKELMLNPKMTNLNMFTSYYMEKNINLILNQDLKTIDESVLEESVKCDASDYGLPEKKKYPMPDKAHVLSAIKFFNYVSSEDEAELAKNINAHIKKYDMKDEVHVGDQNRFKEYFKESGSNIEAPMELDKYSEFISEDFIQTPNNLFVFNEESDKFSPKLKKLLYKERIKTNKDLMNFYEKVQTEVPIINKAYLRLDLYKTYNLFIDWSYYSELFFKNNKWSKERGLEVYYAFLNRFLLDKRYLEAGYNYKTVFISLDGWNIEKDSDVFDYTKNINPISLIYRWMKTNNVDRIKRDWSGMDFVFLSKNGYFKIKFDDFDKKMLTKFISNIRRISEGPVVDDMKTDSAAAITTALVDKIEKSTNIQIYNLTGVNKTKSKEDLDVEISKAVSSEDQEKKKEAIIDYIRNTADSASTTQEAEDKLNTDETMKRLLVDLTTNNDNSIKISATRAKRIESLHSDFLTKKIEGKTVEELLANAHNSNTQIKETKLPIDSIDDEWSHLKFMNFEKAYDAKEDIVAILDDFKNKSIPLSIVDFNITDASTSEDLIDLYDIKFEDAFGKRFNMKLDVPKMKNGRFMRLRGNDKILQGQLMLLPIIKTGLDTTQIVSNYNKIFIRRYGTVAGKSNIMTDRIMKVLRKLIDKKNNYKTKIKITTGNNTKICYKYDLPIDYIDIASEITKIEIPGDSRRAVYYFNQDELKKVIEETKPDVGLPDGVNVGISEIKGKKPVTMQFFESDNGMMFSESLLDDLMRDETFKELYENTNESVKYTYSKASIMNTEIPVIVVMGYSEGLQTSLKKAKIDFKITDKRENVDKDKTGVIRFNDGYIYYANTYNSSLLLNGLKECNTEDYSIKNMDDKAMWLDFLDLFGGRILADGLDAFYDLMMDPITVQVCKDYELPYDYCEALAYASHLLTNNKFNRHVDITGNRLRTNEIVAGYFYKVISKAYSDYQRQLKHNKGDASFSCKKSAVIDEIMLDPTESDASSINPILDIEQASALSFKGLSGLNSDRAYGLDKRTYDESMIGTVAMSTGFSGNVGLTRWSTIDANITNKRGYIKKNTNLKMSDTKLLCMTEALTPFGTTGDDPFRTAMTFIQTSKHGMRVNGGQPMLISDGADEAVSYMSGDTFSFKSKQAGVVKELTEDHLVIEYADKTYEYVDLSENIKKNSDGGFFITVKLSPNVTKGQHVKPGQIVAYDKLCFSNKVSNTDVVFMGNCGLVKAAILPTDEGFEDSAIIDDSLSEMLASDIVVEDNRVLNRLSNVYHIAKPGDPIQEGEPLLIFQNAFEEEDANALVKVLGADNKEVNELGRISIKAHVTGIVQDVRLYRTVELNELSPSLRKIFKEYEANVKKKKAIMEKYHINSNAYDASTEKLEPIGKLKGAADGVYIEFFLKYHDKMSVGDKLVYYSANKGTVKSIFPKGQEPYTQFRPKEKIKTFVSIGSINRRMVTSIMKVGSIQKILIELDRKVKDMFDIKYPDNIE